MNDQTLDREKLQRLINLTAQVEHLNTKISFGVQVSPTDIDKLGDNQREFAELLGFFDLHPPKR